MEEVSSLSERLRQQASDGRGDTLELAKRVNDFQARIRAMTKKMMATVSELSMYQVRRTSGYSLARTLVCLNKTSLSRLRP